MTIPKDVIDRIRQAADIVAIVGQSVTLKQTGNHFSGLCPFHREKTPSFKVFPDSQNFHCFGCGEGGSVFDFVMKTDGLSFPEAVRQLGAEVGVEVPDRDVHDEADDVRAEISETLELAARFFVSELGGPRGGPARTYLAGRGLTDETIARYRLGLAPAGWDNLIRALARHRDPAALERAGLAIPGKKSGRHYDRFRDRIVFPITGPSGRVVGFGGRVLGDEEPKYLNSPETPVYHKSSVLYGIREARTLARQEKRVIIVEGYMDVLALHQAGVTNAVATCGTAVTADHARVLSRFAPEIVFVFDGDEAGLRAALRGFETLLPTGVTVSAVELSKGQDPDDIVREGGAEAFGARVEARQDVVGFFYRQSRGDPKPAAVDRLASLVARVPERIPRRELSARAADWFKFDETTFVDAVEARTAGRGGPVPVAVRRPGGREVTGVEADLLRAVLADPSFWGELAELLAHEGIRQTLSRRVRPCVFELLDRIGASEAPVAPASLRDQVHDDAVRAFVMAVAAEPPPSTAVLRQLQRDLATSLPRMALEREADRLRRAIGESSRRGDQEEADRLAARFLDVKKRLEEIGRAGEPASAERGDR